MKKIYCDICGKYILNPDDAHCLVLPVWNKVIQRWVMGEYSDACNECTDSIAIYIATLFPTAKSRDETERDSAHAAEWHPASECPPADGRYLVADSRLSVSGRPHVSIAMYSRDDDEWATNALIHPEDIVCWTDIPETPDRFFKEKDLIEEDDEQ